MVHSESEAVRMGTTGGRAVIAAAVLGSGMVFLDGTVVNVALKTIGTDLDASFAELQWVTNGYLLSLASLILLGGSLGDRFGRRRVFVVGVVWFAVAFDAAYGTAMLACAVLLFAGGLVSWATIRNHVLEDPSTLEEGRAGEGRRCEHAHSGSRRRRWC